MSISTTALATRGSGTDQGSTSPTDNKPNTPSLFDGLSFDNIPAPQLTGMQYTLTRQNLRPFDSPYAGPLSLSGTGATESTHTFGLYLGWEPIKHTQLYVDTEMFKGEGISNATGLGSLTNGDAIRAGSQGLGNGPYLARAYIRQLFALPGSQEQQITRGQDQLATAEPDRRIEIKFGKMAVSDDFDRNRYANSTRTQFQNWSLFNNTGWDYAADTRGYTTGGLLAYVDPIWALRVGAYKMPRFANGQPLDPFSRSRGENIELSWSQPKDLGLIIRALAYQNVASMGSYHEALTVGQQLGQLPSIQVNDRAKRQKSGVGLNLEQPLADNGDTGLFARLGWNNGHTESFAFTEVDQHVSVGAQIAGVHWQRPTDRIGIAYVLGGLSQAHRDYLVAGGQGFVLGDGKLNYGNEQVLETYYRFQAMRGVQLSPDYQYIVNPGFNRDRGPAHVFGVRLHLEY